MSQKSKNDSKKLKRKISTFIGAIKTADVELAKEFFDDYDFIEVNMASVTSDVIKSTNIYKMAMDCGLEDLVFSRVDSSKIDEFTLEVMKSRNFYALDFIINNAKELNFDINATIKNRGYMEIALFFNCPESLELLLINEIKITKKVSSSCESWISDNFMFLDNPMHSHFKNKNWRSDFLQILTILKNSGWETISRLATDLLNTNSSKFIKSARRTLSTRDIDSERVIRLLNKLDKETLLLIRDSLNV